MDSLQQCCPPRLLALTWPPLLCSAGCAPSLRFNIIITAERVSGYYIITAIVPIALNVYLGLLVFAVHPKSLVSTSPSTCTLPS